MNTLQPSSTLLLPSWRATLQPSSAYIDRRGEGEVVLTREINSSRRVVTPAFSFAIK